MLRVAFGAVCCSCALGSWLGVCGGGARAGGGWRSRAVARARRKTVETPALAAALLVRPRPRGARRPLARALAPRWAAAQTSRVLLVAWAWPVAVLAAAVAASAADRVAWAVSRRCLSKPRARP